MIQKLADGPDQSPGIEIVEEGACIAGIHTPSSTTQSRELSLQPSDQLLNHLGYHVAIIGATGAVGQEMLRVLAERKFPIQRIRCFASPQSVGKKLNETITVEALAEGCFRNIDIALFSAGKKISLAYVPQALKEGCLVIDNSSAYRMDPEVPLVVPEINLYASKDHRLIASPNCTATMIAMALFPLVKKAKIRRIVATTFQAASGAGHRAMVELMEETQAILEHRSYERTVMKQPYGFNLFPHNAPMTPSHYNDEEMKVIEETRKILSEPNLRIGISCVRVPVLRAHSIALNVEFTSFLSANDARKTLEQSAGIKVLEDWGNNRFPTPLDATAQNEVFVGRIREDCSQPNTLDLWVVGDQLLKGAALNTIQIAESITCLTRSK